MEKQIKEDFIDLLNSWWDKEIYGKKPNNKQMELFFELWKTEYVGLENWEELVKVHNELHTDMGYWFDSFQEGVSEFMWSELRIIED